MLLKLKIISWPKYFGFYREQSIVFVMEFVQVMFCFPCTVFSILLSPTLEISNLYFTLITTLPHPLLYTSHWNHCLHSVYLHNNTLVMWNVECFTSVLKYSLLSCSNSLHTGTTSLWNTHKSVLIISIYYIISIILH